MKKESFYITTTIPYVNADPHIGFALELVQADAIARYERLIGKDVFFNTGTDEHGQKIYEASQKEGKDVQLYVDEYAQNYLNLKKVLNLSNDNFIRTTSKEHILAAQEFWRLCDAKGDIYKKKYKGLYCVGCEKFITEKDLMNGKCEFHITLTPEIVEEENYFFRLNNYREKLLEYLSNPESIFPNWRRKEAIEFVQDSMEDFSISRDKKRFSWGISIPGDDTQIMYVWFDALVNYISTLGWPSIRVPPLLIEEGVGGGDSRHIPPRPDLSLGTPPQQGGEESLFEKFWQNGETIQIAGKDMVKFQSVMWQGMLMSAGLATTNKIVYHGFITGEGGVRMSKSIGNVINPSEVVQEYGTDALRYFLLREISSFEDSPFAMERFKDAYNSGLANGLGNLASRIMKMATTNLEKPIEITPFMYDTVFKKNMESYNIQKAVELIWLWIGELDAIIQEKEPFKLIKTNSQKAKDIIEDLVDKLANIAFHLKSILPETSEKILDLIYNHENPKKPLFLRKE